MPNESGPYGAFARESLTCALQVQHQLVCMEYAAKMAGQILEQLPITSAQLAVGHCEPELADRLPERDQRQYGLTPADTDQQIADKLVLSPRTVHAHISSIYSKLAVTSRSAATRYAMEHHLA